MARAKISTTMQATGICWYQAKLWNISTGQVPSSLKTQAGELAGPVVMSPASAGQNPDNIGLASVLGLSAWGGAAAAIMTAWGE